MGVVIPPSILMVIYGATAGVSIGALFIAGALPGIAMGLALIIQSHVFAVRYDFPREHPKFLGFAAVGRGFLHGAWPLGVPFIIIAGMVGGVFTPTEAAAVAAVYALFVTMGIYRSLDVRRLPACSRRRRSSSRKILFCVAGASIFGWILSYFQAPAAVTALILGFTQDWRVVILLIFVLFIVLGTFMDALPAILIFVPIVQPVAVEVGIHPVHLGVVVIMTLALGLLTPPYGLCALTACAVARIPVTRSPWAPHVMMIALVAVVLASAFVPQFVLFLPELLVPQWL
jgi:tripartite ATP-independent transporter DctM subunit